MSEASLNTLNATPKLKSVGAKAYSNFFQIFFYSTNIFYSTNLILNLYFNAENITFSIMVSRWA